MIVIIYYEGAGMNEMKTKGSASDHLANERTFLAWIRTSIGIMAFGFVVVKFTLFIKQLAMALNSNIALPQHGYSSLMGIALVAFGAFTGLFAFARYKKVARRLNNEAYQQDHLLITLLTVFTILMGLLLVAYLIHSIWFE